MVRSAGKLYASLAVIIPLLAIVPARAADQPEAKYHATREDVGTKIMWADDNLNPGDPGARLEIVFPSASIDVLSALKDWRFLGSSSILPDISAG
jgi:hypothetical protein